MVRIFSQENQCLSKCLKDKEKQHGKDYPRKQKLWQGPELSKKLAESKEDRGTAVQVTCSLAVSFHCFFQNKICIQHFLILVSG